MKIIDGKKWAAEVSESLKEEIAKLGEITLAIVLVGNNPSSQIYVQNKMKKCTELGIKTVLHHFDNIKEEELITLINNLNNDAKITGILVQSPLPKNINEKKIMSLITPLKDADGFTAENVGALALNEEKIVAATPTGIITLLEKEHIPIAGKHAVIVGRSNIVGRPLALALLNRDATVTICHSKTPNLKEITRQADILIVAIGKANFITDEYVKEGAVVIDVGINRIDGKVVGDVDFDKVKDKVSFISPVPGGVGPMTVVSLLSNIVKLARGQK